MLADLEASIARDLDILGYPKPEWLAPRTRRDGAHVFEALVVGGGQSGLGVAFGLMRENVGNVLVVDENPEDQEGPWRTFARMLTLRTPKHVLGPDYGIPNLSVRAWYEAQHGHGAWERMGLIPKETWADYLKWYRSYLRIPVRNDRRAGPIVWDADEHVFVVPLASRSGESETVYARKVILATGIDGSGEWHVPAEVKENLPRGRWAHTREPISFEALSGKRVAVLGAGASAFDNASVALESGAKEVHLYFRRSEMVRINPYRWAEFVGFLKHHGDAPDRERWRFVLQLLRMGQLPPSDTYARATKWPNFHLHPGSPWTSIGMEGDAIRLVTPKREDLVDFVIVGSGFSTDLSLRTELSALYPHLALWRDRYSPEPGEENADMARHPYLGSHFELQEKEPGKAPWISGVFNFTFGGLLSLGFGGASISGMKYAMPRLVFGVTKQLYLEDIGRHYDRLCAYDQTEF
jgi:FAD-dependent urate hydroxylase